MTGRRRVVDAWLRVVTNPPAAYYACQICPYTASVKGAKRVAAFAASIRTDHRATCPTLHPERQHAA